MCFHEHRFIRSPSTARVVNTKWNEARLCAGFVRLWMELAGRKQMHGNELRRFLMWVCWLSASMVMAAPENLARKAKVTASSVHSSPYLAEFVADGKIPDHGTRKSNGQEWAAQGNKHPKGVSLNFTWKTRKPLPNWSIIAGPTTRLKGSRITKFMPVQQRNRSIKENSSRDTGPSGSSFPKPLKPFP